MSRPSPQERAVDCRNCVHVLDVREGKSYQCGAPGVASAPLPWRFVASYPCDDFKPASPPVIADREGPDWTQAAREVLRDVGCESECPSEMVGGPGERTAIHRVGNCAQVARTCSACALRRAISSEEARRARPAGEDPLRTPGRDLFHAVTALDRMFETDSKMTHEQRVAVYRQAYLAQEAWLAIDPEAQTTRTRPAVEDPRDALGEKCRTAFEYILSEHAARFGECDCGICSRAVDAIAAIRAAGEDPRDATIRDLRERLANVEPFAALRAAGVEPTPGAAQTGEALRHGETCQKAPHVGTGYLHDEGADGPYDVDGLTYCGRCHGSMD